MNLIFLCMLLMSGTDNSYQKAETQASLALSSHHEYADTTVYCEGKMKSVVLRDSMINKRGGIGTEYNYPIYKYETEITYYKDNSIAAIEKKEIHLKRYADSGVTTGIQITTTLDPAGTFYFDEERRPVTHKEILQIEAKICKEK
ncbi:MAG: hypothetical protein JWN78_1215 [Bacteroidota bacterium]|nr:hypothetical protein [Bacteroidota bacterium]